MMLQIVLGWVIGSPVLAVLVGKMISLGNRSYPKPVPAAPTGGPLSLVAETEQDALVGSGAPLPLVA